MSGAEHYREAEKLIGYVKESENAPQACASLLAEAQVHATLAVADFLAAIVDRLPYGGTR